MESHLVECSMESYLIRKSKLEDSELLSHCTPIKTRNLEIFDRGDNLLIIIIHYSGYSAHRIIFEVTIEKLFAKVEPLHLMTTTINNKTATVTNLIFHTLDSMVILQSNLLNLRQIYYFRIILQFDYTVKYLRFNPEEGDSCIY